MAEVEDDDPWWWSDKGGLSGGSPNDVGGGDDTLSHELRSPSSSLPSHVQHSANSKLQPGEVVYRYGLSRDMTMEPVQLTIEGIEFRESDVSPLEQLCVTVQLVGMMGEPLSSSTTSTGCSVKQGTKRARWSEHLVLPVRLSDVPEDAMLELVIWGPPRETANQQPTRLGGVRFPMFSREGRLRTGKQELEVVRESLLMAENWTVSRYESEIQRSWCQTTVEFEREEAQLEVATKAFRNHWLNRMAESRLRQVRRARRMQIGENVVGILAIELVNYGLPIVYEPEDDENQQLVVVNETGLLRTTMEDPEIMMRSSHSGGEIIIPDMQFMLRSETFRNVVEGKCYAMRRSLTRKSAGDDPLLRPNVDERERIERILSSLSKPTSEDEDLLWKFRHSLVRNSKALTKVLASVKWDSEDEVAQATKLLSKWESAEVCDVLTLLSGEPEFSHPVVRSYAVKVLSSTGDAVLQLYMPQLIQALRYDSVALLPPSACSSTSQSTSVATTMVCAEGLVEAGRQPGPLQQFLVAKCASNEDLASCLHWYLKVECALARATNSIAAQDIFYPVMEAFREAISHHPQVSRAVQAQDEFVLRIMAAARAAAGASGRHTEKTRVLLAALDRESNAPFAEPIPLAGFLGKRIVRIKKESARIMKSTTSPAVIDFVIQSTMQTSSSSMVVASGVTAQQQQQLPSTLNADGTSMEDSTASIRSATSAGQKQPHHQHGGAAHPSTTEPSTIRIMFKVGDDLRQDQLIIQLIELMDNIFRDNGLDLEMTIYHVLATAPLEGLIEFVPDAMPLSKVINDYGSILGFLKRDEHLHGGRKVVVDRFIRSSAGYAVATYVLGIGDRHLDNIMLRPNGHMFHIDFGYAFGRDPKLFSVLVRISPQMIEAMGTEGEKAFRRHCWEALKALRGQAALILSVLGLMVDASIPDLSKHQMPSAVLAGVQERLRLGFSDEEAERTLTAVIDQSIGALGPRLNERIHQIAQQWI